MATSKFSPQGFFEVVTSSRMDGNLLIFGYGHHEKAINPGDLVITCTQDLQEGRKNQKIEASIKLRGKHMHLFAAAAIQALEMYEENRDWLEAPMSKPADATGQTRLPMAEITQWQEAARRAI